MDCDPEYNVMNVLIKNFINNFGLAFLVLTAALFWVAGCAEPNPVKGWKSWNAQLNPPNLQNYHNYPNTWYYPPDQIYHIDKAVIDDYQDFIEKLKQKNPTLYVSEIYFYEGGTGQHAVKLIIETGPREYVDYFLMYDKSNVRTKVIEGRKWHQFHI